MTPNTCSGRIRGVESDPASLPAPGSWSNLMRRFNVSHRITGEGPNPGGLCMCGCGQPAPIARESHSKKGHVFGKPIRFIYQHHRRLAPQEYIVDENGCWVWQLGKSSGGYGRMRDGEHHRPPAHRVYYERYVGAIPDGMHLDHLCRNRACVNPAHLEPVTPAENSRRGASTKLDVRRVRAIKRRLCDGSTHSALATEYGVSATTISSIASGRLWADVQPDKEAEHE